MRVAYITGYIVCALFFSAIVVKAGSVRRERERKRGNERNEN